MHSRYEYANNFGNITNRVCVITFDNSLTIEVFACLLQTQVGQILQHLQRTLSQFPPTNCIIRYLIRPIPKFNKNLNYSMTEFCSIFYILKSMFWFYFNCFCLQLTTKLKMIKKTHHFRVQLQQQNLTVQKCKIRTVHSTFTIKQIMQLLFQIKAKCKFFFLLFTLQMSVLLLIASGQKSILENSVLGFEKKFNEPL